jgi:hypothetical protein
MTTTTERTCAHGHGPLVRHPGLYALAGAELVAGPQIGLLETQKHIVYNSRAFAVVVYRCSSCGFIELVDEEKAGS